MKCSRGYAFLVVCLLAGGTGADAAFWNRKSSKEEAKPLPVPPTSISVTHPGQAQPEPVLRPVAVSADEGRRAHVQMKDQESVDVLVRLAESRQLREQEIRVLTRLHGEKEGELERMNQRLQDRFGIAPDANYQYDNESKSLYLLTPRAGVEAGEGGAAEDLFDRRLHRNLSNKDIEIEFVRLVSAKKITVSEIQVLKLLLKEKHLELNKVNGTLGERFAISPDKHYEFDADSRTLFEVVRPAGDVPGGNPGR